MVGIVGLDFTCKLLLARSWRAQTRQYVFICIIYISFSIGPKADYIE